MSDWYRIANESEISSPALLVYPDRVAENLRRMIALAGGVDRLRPHVKTHKMPEVIRLCLAAGIERFKAATIAEAEMTAEAGGSDVLLAYPAVGPTAPRLARRTSPSAAFLCRGSSPAARPRFRKAVASEMPQPRVRIFGLEDAAFPMHSEEHLVVETPRAAEFPVGTVLYALPRHVCPTVALHEHAVAVHDGRAAERWHFAARTRRITI